MEALPGCEATLGRRRHLCAATGAPWECPPRSGRPPEADPQGSAFASLRAAGITVTLAGTTLHGLEQHVASGHQRQGHGLTSTRTGQLGPVLEPHTLSFLWDP